MVSVKWFDDWHVLELLISAPAKGKDFLQTCIYGRGVWLFVEDFDDDVDNWSLSMMSRSELEPQLWQDTEIKENTEICNLFVCSNSDLVNYLE